MEEGVYKSENGQSHERRHVVLARLYFSGRDVRKGHGCWRGLSPIPGTLHVPYPCQRSPLPSASGHSLLAGAPGLDCLELTFEEPPAAYATDSLLNGPHLQGIC